MSVDFCGSTIVGQLLVNTQSIQPTQVTPTPKAFYIGFANNSIFWDDGVSSDPNDFSIDKNLGGWRFTTIDGKDVTPSTDQSSNFLLPSGNYKIEYNVNNKTVGYLSTTNYPIPGVPTPAGGKLATISPTDDKSYWIYDQDKGTLRNSAFSQVQDIDKEDQVVLSTPQLGDCPKITLNIVNMTDRDLSVSTNTGERYTFPKNKSSSQEICANDSSVYYNIPGVPALSISPTIDGGNLTYAVYGDTTRQLYGLAVDYRGYLFFPTSSADNSKWTIRYFYPLLYNKCQAFVQEQRSKGLDDSFVDVAYANICSGPASKQLASTFCSCTFTDIPRPSCFDSVCTIKGFLDSKAYNYTKNCGNFVDCRTITNIIAKCDQLTSGELKDNTDCVRIDRQTVNQACSANGGGGGGGGGSSANIKWWGWLLIVLGIIILIIFIALGIYYATRKKK